MKYGCVFAVQDMKVARAFYEELFGLVVAEDYGRNIVFDCGLSLQQDFDWLTGVAREDMKKKENNCEIYFEQEDLDGFARRLKTMQEIVWLHDVKEYPWGQRVLRFYDLDEHLIEVGEPMKAVVERLQTSGLGMEEIATKMDVTINDIKIMLKT